MSKLPKTFTKADAEYVSLLADELETGIHLRHTDRPGVVKILREWASLKQKQNGQPKRYANNAERCKAARIRRKEREQNNS